MPLQVAETPHDPMDVDMENPCRHPLSQSLQLPAGVADSEVLSMGNGRRRVASFVIQFNLVVD